MARLVEVAPVKTALVEKRFVEVAFVLVAFQSERLVTVLEALLTEDAARECSGTETVVPVAVRLAAEMLPEKRPLPWTERSCEGEVVPMPTFPPVVARYVLFVVVSWVVVAFPVTVRRLVEVFQRKLPESMRLPPVEAKGMR